MVDRFWAKVDKRGPVPSYRPDLGECWVWTAGRSKAGYGTFNRGGRIYDLAHRVAYELLVGPIIEGLCLDHLCRVRHCVRPSHVEQVTWNENLRRGAAARRLELSA